jgi:hypothetical protein
MGCAKLLEVAEDVSDQMVEWLLAAGDRGKALIILLAIAGRSRSGACRLLGRSGLAASSLFPVFQLRTRCLAAGSRRAILSP